MGLFYYYWDVEVIGILHEYVWYVCMNTFSVQVKIKAVSGTKGRESVKLLSKHDYSENLVNDEKCDFDESKWMLPGKQFFQILFKSPDLM